MKKQMMSNSFNICVFISGNGSNLASILKHQNIYGYQVSLVVSNNKNANGLLHAKKANVPVYTFDWNDNDKNLYQLQEIIIKYGCKLIALAGFMKILPKNFVLKFNHKIINIHPSLLPKYPGLNTHQKVIDNKDTKHGATVHFVNSQLDAGQIISQCTIDVLPSSNAEILASELLFREHSLYPYTISLIAKNIIYWHEDHLYYNQSKLTQGLIIN